jgi:hypothetical protein
MFLEIRALAVRRAENHTAICQPIVYTMWDSVTFTFNQHFESLGSAVDIAIGCGLDDR